MRLASGLAGPLGGPLAQFDVALTKAVERKRLANVADFLDECARTFPPDTKIEQLERDEFIRSFDLVADAIRFVRNREKIKFFARLLRNALSITNKQETDENEQLIRVIDDLSHRELELLALIAAYDKEYPLSSAVARLTAGPGARRHAHNQTWPQFRDGVIKRYGMNYEDFEDALARLNRTGLCMCPMRGPQDAGPIYPHVTRLFYRLRDIILD